MDDALFLRLFVKDGKHQFMTDHMFHAFKDDNVVASQAEHNLPERTVSELSADLKRAVEGNFSRVRVRGEVGQLKIAGSGHCYLRLKDDAAVLDGVVWRGTYARLAVAPEEGLDVIATGRLTTWAGRSSYQIVIESLELAGEGALLKMLEERRRRLMAAGLFDSNRKKSLPFLPRVIGVVTSPTGAVIRDILHRLADRFPVHVLVWPVVVQGEDAAPQVVAALHGFNALSQSSLSLPRPDLVIVARGGGALEDLMAFNDEAVVRSISDSAIPVISAIGHETDTTLCDLVADLRAPTPTGAAEMAVPVRLDLCLRVAEIGRRLSAAFARAMGDYQTHLHAAARGLLPLDHVIQGPTQRCDDAIERFQLAISVMWKQKKASLSTLAAGIRSPRDVLRASHAHLQHVSSTHDSCFVWTLSRLQAQCDRLVLRLSTVSPQQRIDDSFAPLQSLERRLGATIERMQTEEGRRFDTAQARLEAVSWERVLQRGYVLVRDEAGAIVDRATGVQRGDALFLHFSDGVQRVFSHPVPAPRKRSRKKSSRSQQDSLF